MKRSLRNGFSLTEIIIVVAIGAVLAALLFPSISKMKNKAGMAKCANNMRQLGAALTSFSSDNNSQYPPVANEGRFWPEIVASFLGMDDPAGIYSRKGTIFNCPNHPFPGDLPTEKASTYLMNLRVSSCPPAGISGKPVTAFDNHSKTVLLAESTGQSIWVNATVSWDPRCYSIRHDGAMNILYMDGHVEPHKGSIPKAEEDLFGLVDSTR